jgi:hypothetical protein
MSHACGAAARFPAPRFFLAPSRKSLRGRIKAFRTILQIPVPREPAAAVHGLLARS